MHTKDEIIEINIENLERNLDKINRTFIFIREELLDAIKAKYHLIEDKDYKFSKEQFIKLKQIDEMNSLLIMKITNVKSSINNIHKDIKKIAYKEIKEKYEFT
jgi:hypothetical protein